ncbi:MAG: hypothetical protein ACI4KF_09640 [Huintestinicola sp.]
MNKTKKTFIAIFLLIVFLPVMLMMANKLFNIKVDVSLKGYTDSVEKPSFITSDFVSGVYQANAAQYINENIPLRGVFTRTYNTVRFNLFNQSARVIGKDKYIFEDAYIWAELCIGSDYDFSTEENKQRVADFVAKLSSVQNKLEKSGKKLYLYVIPGKARVFSDKLPEKYLTMRDENSENVVYALRKQLASSDVPVFFCEDYISEMEYPVYYPTGIHWSRTYEQSVSRKIISDLADITGKNYRNITFADVEESKTPFWRDADVWDLANIWNSINCTFYQYRAVPDEHEYFDKMRILIYGDSFGMGLRYDVLSLYPDEGINYINYDNYVMDSREQTTLLNHDWNNFDFQYYLDNTDVVVIEMIDAVAKDLTLGFIDRLDNELDNYVPGKVYESSFDGSSEEQYDMTDSVGMYGKESGFFWVNEEFSLTIDSPGISERGMQIRYAVPDQIINAEGEEKVTFYVNGRLVGENTHTQPGTYELTVAPDMLDNKNNNIYTVSGKCSSYFNPMESGQSDDNRDLALRIEYIGEAIAYPSSFDGLSDNEYDMSDTVGVYGKEPGFFWTNIEFSLTLESAVFSEKGILIRYAVPDQIINSEGEEKITFFVNDRMIGENTHTQPGTYELTITPDMLENNNNIYTVSGKCSSYFNPKVSGQNDDDRDLALRIEYIGEVK